MAGGRDLPLQEFVLAEDGSTLSRLQYIGRLEYAVRLEAVAANGCKDRKDVPTIWVDE